MGPKEQARLTQLKKVHNGPFWSFSLFPLCKCTQQGDLEPGRTVLQNFPIVCYVYNLVKGWGMWAHHSPPTPPRDLYFVQSVYLAADNFKCSPLA